MDLETLQWLQSHSSSPLGANPRRELADGVAFAEVISRHLPDLSLHSFVRGTSTAVRRDNWAQLLRFLVRKDAQLGGGGGGSQPLAKADAEAVLRGVPGAAEALAARLRAWLTAQPQAAGAAPAAPAAGEARVPTFARPTASRVAAAAACEPAVAIIRDVTTQTARVRRRVREHERSLAAARLLPRAVTAARSPERERGADARLRRATGLAGEDAAAASGTGGLLSPIAAAASSLGSSDSGIIGGSSTTSSSGGSRGVALPPPLASPQHAPRAAGVLEQLSALTLEALASAPVLRAFDAQRPPALSFATLVASSAVAPEQALAVCRAVERSVASSGALAAAMAATPRGLLDLAAWALPLLRTLPAASEAFAAVVAVLEGLGGGGSGGGGGGGISSWAASSARTGSLARPTMRTAASMTGRTAASDARLVRALPAGHSALVAATLGRAALRLGSREAAAALASEMLLPQLVALAAASSAKLRALMRVGAALCLSAAAPPLSSAAAASAASAAGCSGELAAAATADYAQQEALALIVRLHDVAAEDDGGFFAACVAALAEAMRVALVWSPAVAAALLAHADAALQQSRPSAGMQPLRARAAALALLRRLLPGVPDLVLARLPHILERLAEDAAAPADWEVRRGLIALAGAVLLVETPPNEGEETAAPAPAPAPATAAAAAAGALAELLSIPADDAVTIVEACVHVLATVAASPAAEPTVLAACATAAAAALQREQQGQSAPPPAALYGALATALVRLPAGARALLLGLASDEVEAVEGEQACGDEVAGAAAAGAAAIAQPPSAVGAVYEDCARPLAMGRLAGLALIESVVTAAAARGAEHLEAGHFAVLLAGLRCVPAGARGAALRTLQPASDLLFVGLADPATSAPACALLRELLSSAPGAAELLAAPMLRGALALILTPPGGARRDAAVEARVAALLADAAAAGGAQHTVVAAALATFAARDAGPGGGGSRFHSLARQLQRGKA